MINSIRIGNVEINKIASLAPMAGITDRAFRQICKNFGASYLVSEMASAKAICYKDNKTDRLLKFSDSERPIGLQLFGSEPEYMSEAAVIVSEKYKPDIIDINMGCPVKKITNNNSGCSLMKDPKLVEKIVNKVVKSVKVPVTVKIRKGWDETHINAVEISKIIESSGASAITIHGRTREQMYSLKCDYNIIREVKESVSIPVIGSGDMVSLESALEMYDKTNCDLIMIGRGSLGNPWIFKDIYNYFFNGGIPKIHSIQEKINVIKRHINLMIKYTSEKIAMQEARKHVMWYTKGMKNSASLRNKISKITKINEFEEILKNFLD